MLNLGPIINQGNPGGRGGLWPWKSGRGEGSRGTGNPGVRGGQKLLPSVGGVWIFSGITHYLFIYLFIFLVYYIYSWYMYKISLNLNLSLGK